MERRAGESVVAAALVFVSVQDLVVCRTRSGRGKLRSRRRFPRRRETSGLLRLVGDMNSIGRVSSSSEHQRVCKWAASGVQGKWSQSHSREGQVVRTGEQVLNQAKALVVRIQERGCQRLVWLSCCSVRGLKVIDTSHNSSPSQA